jgi:hypothetical protein
MAKKPSGSNGHTGLEEATRQLEIAMATSIQTQASILSQMAEQQREMAKHQRETAERFERIEAQMAEIIRVLNEHTRVLERLPEAVRDKIGFKPQQ